MLAADPAGLSGYDLVSFLGATERLTAWAQSRHLTIQIRENGSYRNYGTRFETTSTSRTLIMSDGAPRKAGCFYYRGRIHREGFHGNWSSNDWYGLSIYACR